MSWDHNYISEQRRHLTDKFMKEASREDLINRILELETALYPFVVTLGSIGDDQTQNRYQGTSINSKLFPLLDKDDNYLVFNPETKTQSKIQTITERELHNVEYYERDGMMINAGHELHDDFEIISINQNDIGCSIHCGTITMGDIRFAQKVLFAKKD